MSTFRMHPHPLEGNTCPVCGVTYEFCEVAGCNNFAAYEGWVKAGIMLQRRRLCREHAVLTKGYKAKGEKVFEEAK